MKYQGSSVEVRVAQASKFERTLACAVIAKAVEDYRAGPRSPHYASAEKFMFSTEKRWADQRETLLGLTSLGDNVFSMARRSHYRPSAHTSFSRRSGDASKVERRKSA